MASSPQPTTKEWIQSLLDPGQLLFHAMTYYVKANIDAVFKRGEVLAPLLQTGKLRDEAFGKFWVAFSTTREEDANGEETPLSPSPAPAGTDVETEAEPPKIQMSSDLIPPVLAQASGIVLDVGPGTGTQMPLLRSPAIKEIYGAEPCHGLHAELRARAQAEGLGEKYHVVPSSVVAAELVPALRKEGLAPALSSAEGVFDTIICVRVLCSVPDMRRTIGELYGLLKPGGKLLVTEHVVNPWRSPKGSVVARLFQTAYRFLGWSWCLGDCCLNRDTETALRAAAERDGGWAAVDLDRSFGWSPLPYISGVLVKKSS